MTDEQLFKAIRYLKPTAEFSFIGNDYSTIKWDLLEGEAPTQTEIEAAVEQIKLNEAQIEAEKAITKANLLNRLGITENEFKLLFK